MLDESNPLVSVVLAAYNAEPYIREAVDSVVQQTYRNFELIIVDDSSTDKTPEILAEYTDPRVIVVRNEKILERTSLRIAGLQWRGEN